MLTCKVGNTTINCFDGKYDKHMLKKWDEEKRLICPDCGKLYEYCHGEVNSPYFRHKEKSKECEDIFSEPETEEHIKGKQILYNWLLELQNKGEISDLKLEAYIPETRQRPDLYFMKDNKRYVVEFQCSPIATEYISRHKLYELAGINDIWILGTLKYNINLYNSHAKHYSRVRTIEKNSNYYLDYNNSILYINSELIKSKLIYKQLRLFEYIGNSIDNLVINDENIIFIKDEVLNQYIDDDYQYYLQHKEQIEEERQRQLEIQNRRNHIMQKTTSMLNKNNVGYDISYRDGYSYYYNSAIDIEIKYISNSTNYVLNFVFFIKDKTIDFCKMNYNRPKYENLDSYQQEDKIQDEDISNYIFNKMLDFKSLIYNPCICIDCNKYFKLTIGEMEFFNSKGLKYPKRCKQCREKRKKITKAVLED